MPALNATALGLWAGLRRNDGGYFELLFVTLAGLVLGLAFAVRRPAPAAESPPSPSREGLLN